MDLQSPSSKHVQKPKQEEVFEEASEKLRKFSSHVQREKVPKIFFPLDTRKPEEMENSEKAWLQAGTL